ncbi:FAD-dependent oxidoreductase [Roseibium salinum]|nr:FAD-dependent oxidoreductase [Roseibium salinum]
MGSRPCLPDSLPVVGASPTIPRLWLNFGHADDGFTLGPITGRLLAEMIGGKSPFLDMSGLSPLRFVT